VKKEILEGKLQAIEEIAKVQVQIMNDITTGGETNLYADGVKEGWRQAYAVIKRINERDEK
jgi:hypothetical protein